MTDQSVRVLLRLHLGAPYRLASEEERQQSSAKFSQILKKWKASGVKLLGAYSAYGEGLGGFSHHLILDVSGPQGVEELNNDIFGSGMLFERHSIDSGHMPSPIERMWQEA